EPGREVGGDWSEASTAHFEARFAGLFCESTPHSWQRSRRDAPCRFLVPAMRCGTLGQREQHSRNCRLVRSWCVCGNRIAAMSKLRRLRRLVPDEALFDRRVAGESLRVLARDYGVEHSTLSDFFRRLD